MKKKTKRLTLALGLLTVITIIAIACTNLASSETTLISEARVTGALTQYVVKNGAQWIMQTTYKFLQIK